MKRPAEEPAGLDAPSATQDGDASTAAVAPAGAAAPSGPTDPRKRLAIHASTNHKEADLAPPQDTADAADQAQAQPQQQPQQQAGDPSQPQPGSIAPPMPPPGPAPPSAYRNTKHADTGRQGVPSQHMVPATGWGPPPAGPFDAPHPPLGDVAPWEGPPQHYWDDPGGPGGHPPLPMQPWEGRGPPPHGHPGPFWDRPGMSPRRHNQYQKQGYGDRGHPFHEPQWAADRHRDPLGDPHMAGSLQGSPRGPGSGYRGPPRGPPGYEDGGSGSSRDFDMEGGRGRGRGRGYEGSRGRGRGYDSDRGLPGRGRGYDLDRSRGGDHEADRGRGGGFEADRVRGPPGYPDSRGPHREDSLGPRGQRHPHGPHQPLDEHMRGRGRGRGRGSEGGSGGSGSSSSRHGRPDEGGGPSWGPGGARGWGGDRSWEGPDDRLRGPTGVVRRSGDRRLPPGRGGDSRGRPLGPQADTGRPGSPVRSGAKANGSSSMRSSGSGSRAPATGPRAKDAGQSTRSRDDSKGGRDRSRERSRDRSRGQSRGSREAGRSPERSGRERRGVEATGPKRALSPTSHSGRSPGSSPVRRSSADGAASSTRKASSMVVPGAKEAYAATAAARRGGGLPPAAAASSAAAPGSTGAAEDPAQPASRPALCALIWAQQESIRLQLVDLQGCVPGLQPQHDAAATLQLLFVEQYQQQTLVLAGPVTVVAALSGDGRVGFIGEELKPVLQQLHGSVITDIHASEPNPDKVRDVDNSQGWPDALIVTIKRPERPAAANPSTSSSGLSARDPRASMLQQQQQQLTAMHPAWAQQQQQLLQPVGQLEQEAPSFVSQPEASMQQQVVWPEQQQQQPVGQQRVVQDQLPWVNTSSTGMMPQPMDVAYVQQPLQQQAVMQYMPDPMLQQSSSVMVAADSMQGMNMVNQGLQVVSPHAGAGAAPALSTAGSFVASAAAASAAAAAAAAATTVVPTYHVTPALQPGDSAAAMLVPGMSGAVLVGASGSGASVATDMQDNTSAVVAAGAAGETAGGAPAAAGDAAAALAAALPSLPAPSASDPAAAMTDEVVDAVMDLVSVLNKNYDPSLDIGSCAEALFEIQEDPAAAKKFMRVTYMALGSAVRRSNAAGAVSVVKRYLQKATAC